VKKHNKQTKLTMKVDPKPLFLHKNIEHNWNKTSRSKRKVYGRKRMNALRRGN